MADQALWTVLVGETAPSFQSDLFGQKFVTICDPGFQGIVLYNNASVNKNIGRQVLVLMLFSCVVWR
jgi:hypothetical protein